MDCQVIVHVADLTLWGMTVFFWKLTTAILLGVGVGALPSLVVVSIFDRRQKNA